MVTRYHELKPRSVPVDIFILVFTKKIKNHKIINQKKSRTHFFWNNLPLDFYISWIYHYIATGKGAKFYIKDIKKAIHIVELYIAFPTKNYRFIKSLSTRLKCTRSQKVKNAERRRQNSGLLKCSH